MRSYGEYMTWENTVYGMNEENMGKKTWWTCEKNNTSMNSMEISMKLWKKNAKLKLHEMPTAVFKMISSASEWYAVSSPRLPCTQRSCTINRWIFGQNWPGLSEQHLSTKLLTAVKKRHHWFLTPYLPWQSIKTRSGNYTKCHILHPIWSILGPSIQAQHGAFFSGRGQELKVLA